MRTFFQHGTSNQFSLPLSFFSKQKVHISTFFILTSAEHVPRHTAALSLTPPKCSEVPRLPSSLIL